MFPLRDNVPKRRFPAVTLAIIFLNILVFLQELKLGRHLGPFMVQYALIPARYMRPDEAAMLFGPFQNLGAALLPFFSSMFLHGGWLHLIGNMWAFWIFGDSVEGRIGPGRFTALYLTSGVAAGLLHVFTNPHSEVPTLGASGAIAGVMGAYFRFFPGAKVETLVPPFFFGPIFVLPAVVFLGLWFLLQFFNGVLTLGTGNNFGGVA